MTPGNPAQPDKSQPRWKWWSFRLGGLLLGCLPLLALEWTLAALGVGAPREGYQDPYIGFSSVQPLFEYEPQSEQYVTSHSRRLMFGTQEFPRRKPGYRIFGLGGSTVRGRPYETRSSFLEWMRLELGAVDPGTRYEAINCGGLSYASYRLTYLLQEVLRYEPDAIVIATGHNEFLEDRTYRDVKRHSAAFRWLSGAVSSLRTVNALRAWRNPTAADAGDDGRTVLAPDVEARLDAASGYASYHRDPAWREAVIRHFETSLRAMAAMCRENRVPLVLVKLGANQRDCPPFKSQHGEGLPGRALQTWQAAFDEAQTLEQSGQLAEALASYQRALGIDDQYALLQFRLARLLDRLDRPQEAHHHYLAAQQLDVCPLRAVEELGEVVERVARDAGALLVDATQLSSPQVDHSATPGHLDYVDHVHPTLGGHQRLGAAVARALREAGLVPVGQPLDAAGRRALYRAHFRRLGDRYLADAGRRVGWLENWARRHKLHDETLPRDPGAMLRYGTRHLEFGEWDEAWQWYQRALEAAPQRAIQAILARSADLFREGRGRQAADLLDELQRRLPDDTRQPAELAIDYARSVLAWESGSRQEAQAMRARHPDALANLPADLPWLAPDMPHPATP